MAKYYGIGGKRKGSVGNETYSIVKGTNVVKSKIIQVNDAKTPDQIEQRSKLQNVVKSFQNLGTEFLSKCFEKKKQKQSTYNAYVSLNAKLAQPMFKKYSDDRNIIGIGNFEISNGSLPTLPIIKSAKIQENEKDYYYYGIDLGAEIDVDATVSAVSSALITKYNLSEGMLLNGISIYNEGVAFKNDNNNPLTLGLVYSVKRSKNNFILSKSDNNKVITKGFKVVNDGQTKLLVILDENSNEKIAEGCVAETTDEEIASIGYCAYFISHKVNGKILVSTSKANNNKGLTDLINLINANPQNFRGWLSTTMKILIIMSYGIKKVIEIIRDWPI